MSHASPGRNSRLNSEQNRVVLSQNEEQDHYDPDIDYEFPPEEEHKLTLINGR
jgi:hypothetical protein